MVGCNEDGWTCQWRETFGYECTRQCLFATDCKGAPGGVEAWCRKSGVTGEGQCYCDPGPDCLQCQDNPEGCEEFGLQCLQVNMEGPGGSTREVSICTILCPNDNFCPLDYMCVKDTPQEPGFCIPDDCTKISGD